MLRNSYFGETKTHYKLYKCGKKWAVMGISLFSLGLGMLVTSRPVSADVTATSVSSSAVNVDATSASSSSSVKADATSASSSSSVKADATSASSSSSVKADATSASSSSAVKAETTSASSSSAVKAETTSASSSSAVKAETTSVSSSNAVKAETTSASSSSAVKAETTSASSSSAVKAETTSASSSSAVKAETTSVSSSNAVKAETTSASSSSAAKANITSVKTRQNVTKISYNTLLQQLRTSKALAASEDTLTHVTKDNFLDYFSLNGSASYDKNSGVVTITPNRNNQVGNFSLNSKIDMNKSFTLTGQVKLGSDPNGADGIGFAFHSGNTTDMGNAGGNLGIGGLQDAIGFKLDTWNNGYQAPSSDKDGSEILPTDSNGFGWNKDSMNAPYGTFVNTSNQEVKTQDGSMVQRWWAQDTGNPQALSKADIDGKFHNFEVNYDGTTRTLTVSYTQASGKVLTWITTVDSSYQAMSMIISASTGGAKNLQQFKIDDFNFQQAATVNVKYVDIQGNQIAQGIVSYPDGTNVNGTYVTTQLDIPNYTFIKMSDGSLESTGSLTKPGDNGTVIYVYAPAYTATSKTVNETIHYVDQDGKAVAASHIAEQITFLTVTNPVDGSAVVYYSNITTDVSLDKETGAPTATGWTKATSADFSEVANPVVKGYTITSNDAPNSDLKSVAVQTVYINSSDLDFTVVYTKDAPTVTTENKTVNETIHYVYKDGTTAHDDYVATPVEFTRQVSTDAVTGEKTYGSWSADQSFAAVTSPAIKGYTPDQAEIGAQTVSGDASDLDFTVVYTKDAPTVTTENKTVNETIHYVYKDGTTAHDDYVATPVEFTRQVSTDAVTGEKTYGSWSADQSFAAVTSPAIKGYTPDQAEIGVQTVSGDASDLDFTVVYTKDAPTVTTENKTVNETIHYVYKDGTTAHDDYVATPVEFTRQVSTDAVTGEKTYGSWSADQSFAAVTSPAIKGYTPDQAEIGAQTVSGDASDLDFTVVYTKDAPTVTTENKTVNETIHYVYKDGTTAHDDYVATPVEFTRQVSTDAVTGEKTYGSWSADQSFAAVTSPAIKGYTPDQAEIGAQTVSGDASDLDFTVVYTKDAPTVTTENKTVNETIHYVYKDGTTAHDDYVATPVEFTRQVSTDAVTGEKTYGSWSADQSFAAVTSPAIKGYTPDQAEIGAQTVSGDASDLDFTVVYTKDAPTVTTENKTVNETIHYVYKDGTTAHDDYVATPVEFTRQVSTDAVTGEKTYGSWSADQSFAAVTSPAIKGYTPDQAEIGVQTVSGDASDLDFTVVYTKDAPTVTTENKTVNETIHYVYKDGTTAHDDYVATPVEFTRQVSTDAVTGEKTYGSWSADQSFAAVTSPAIKGYTPDQAEIGAQTVSGDASDLDFTVVYAKDAPKKPVNPSQPTTPTKPVNPSQPTTPTKPVNPSQPTTPTKPVNPSQPTTPTKPVNPSQPTTPAKTVQAGQAAATNFVDQRLPQTDETDQQHMTLSGLLLLAMSSLLGLFGMTKRQRKE
ncbi:mucin-binding protein [Lactiplantibacillus plantarum]|uniref:mucin-binding protein n=1 Tax=Lactiplantibacillus plantarum TaxID=1590 RepID=UPI001651DA8D|nr:MucBP domain-containing protein [Lactiplantibacillus plantarum]